MEILILTFLLLFTNLCAASQAKVAATLPTAIRQRQKPATVIFAADDTVKLYKNGKRIGSVETYQDIGSVDLSLRKGDVIALIATDYGQGYGAVAAILYGTRRISTGRQTWKARKAFSTNPGPNAWMKSSYSVCDWPDSVVAISAGKPADFPLDSTGARYVWAADAGEGDTIFLRFQIGGERCQKSPRPNPPVTQPDAQPPMGRRKKKSLSTIYYAADNEIAVFVNGKVSTLMKDYTKVGTLRARLKDGDVISVFTRDTGGGGYGAIIGIVGNGVNVATGRDDWRAIGFRNADNAANWKKQDYDDCDWPLAVTRSSAGRAPNFPYTQTSAQYVWAADTAGETSVFMRYTIGGSKCGSFAMADSIYVAADNEVTVFVNGKEVVSNFDYLKSSVASYSVRPGDVVAVVATDTGLGYGVAVAVVKDGTLYVTGRNEWRATKSLSGNGNAWMLPSFKACDWSQAELSLNVGKAAGFPFKETRAQYVWASNAGEFDTIFMRYTVGGDTC